MSKSEAVVKKEVKDWLKAHHVYDLAALRKAQKEKTLILGFFYMPVPMGMGVRGIPDFSICFRGRHVVAEAKREDRPATPSPDQRLHIEAVKAAGGEGFTFNSLESFVAQWVKLIDPDHYFRYPEEKP